MFTSSRLISHKKILLLAVGILALGLSVYITSTSPTEDPPTESDIAHIKENTPAYSKVFIGDTFDFVNDTTKTSIEHTLYHHIDTTKPDLYTGVVRKDSFSKATTPSGQSRLSLLIDVYPIESTYRVTLFSHQDVYSVNVDCAPQSQQKEPSNKCINVLHHD